jgi:hypothetical protein
MTNNKQQTAVEWLQSIELERDLTLADWKQAKEMEKEQHGKTFHVGVQWIQYQMDSIHGCLEYWDQEPPEFETFYNETYGGGEQ